MELLLQLRLVAAPSKTVTKLLEHLILVKLFAAFQPIALSWPKISKHLSQLYPYTTCIPMNLHILLKVQKHIILKWNSAVNHNEGF